jgi:phospholipid/cholesterol/gamma-HCH transport system ATP-binding protein
MARTHREVEVIESPAQFRQREAGVMFDYARPELFSANRHGQATPAIEFRDVHLWFDDHKVLDGLSFKVMEGETRIILGGSGGGKSTIIKLVLGLLKPDSGRVLVEGEDITDYSEVEMMRVRNKIGMVFQDGALFDSLSVFENVAFRLHEQGVPKAKVESEVRQMLSFVGLEDAIGKLPAELSGGMRRRVGIARALVGGPKIVLFDEPTAGLDPPTSRTICELAMKLRDLEDVSSLFVTHEMSNLSHLCREYATISEDGELIFELEGEGLCLINTKVMMLRDGRAIFNGTDESLLAASDPYVQRFIRGR